MFSLRSGGLNSVQAGNNAFMFLDTIHGMIDRRVLLNYRIDPEVLRRVLPPPFKPSCMPVTAWAAFA